MQTLPIWHNKLLNATQESQSDPTSRYLQLASVSLDGVPQARTVVFRGFVENNSDIIIHTDVRSDKIAQIKLAPAVELCWYFADSREQFRIAGNIEIIDFADPANAQLRLQQWNNLSAAAQSSYFWPTPGRMLGLNEEEKANAPLDNSSHSQVSKHFALLILHPIKVDHLELKQTPHRRTAYQRDDNHWHQNLINP